jgi:hypothetical protein
VSQFDVDQIKIGLIISRIQCFLAAEDDKDGGARQNNNNIPESIRLRAIVVANIRPTAGIQVRFLSHILNNVH